MHENSAIALEKLRALVSEYEQRKEKRLPPREELLKRIGVGQRALRRALNVLEMEGVVSVKKGAGIYLGSARNPKLASKLFPDFASIVEVMKIRLVFEPFLCRVATDNIKSENFSRMQHAQNKLLNPKDFDSAELWDSTFHREIAIATNSKLYLDLFDRINLIRQSEKWRLVRQELRDEQYIRLNHHDHSKIYIGLLMKDANSAAQAMEIHIGRLFNRLITHYPESLHDTAKKRS